MLANGTQIERWIVEGLLGRGGMAEVYAVRHALLGTPGALKVLALRSPDLVQRLLREGRAQGRLQHPNIVAVTDVLEVDGAPALLMERVPGPSLAEVRAAGVLDPARVARLAAGMLQGLAAAHGDGIIHRDLKPSNVLLAPGDVPRITDFGLARALAGDIGEALTEPGVGMGTTAYMAPEQLRDARTADARSDLYAMGAMLYELVCGEAPARGLDVVAAWQRASSRDFQRPRDRIPDVPETLDRTIWWALEPDPAARPPSAEAMLQSLTGTKAPSTPPAAFEGADSSVPSRSSASILPGTARPLLGRDLLVGAVLTRLDDRAGWLTLTGTGGCGKTRIATEIVRTWAQIGGRALWIDLQPARREEDLDRSLMWALDLHQDGPDAIPRALAGLGRALLVVDNLEQLSREACARLATWTRSAPSLRVLATSRRLVQVPEEESQPVEPLQIPDAETVFASPAWALLRDAAPPQALRGVDREDAVALLRSLDGLPLAIQLAGARLEVLGVRQLLARLGDRFSVLSDPEAPGTRHGALYDTIAWSWSLLEAPDQDTLAQASVFRAPFTLEAAEAVIALEESQVLDALHVLVRRHLVVREGRRFRMLESIRAFARQQLDAPGLRAVFRRHGHWLGAAAVARMGSPTTAQLQRTIQRHAPEIHALIDRASDDPELVPDALRGGQNLMWMMHSAPSLQDSLQLAERLMALPEDDRARHAHTTILTARAEALRQLGRSDEAEIGLRDALARAERYDDNHVRVQALVMLADLVNHRGDWRTAAELYRRAIVLADDHDEHRVQATARAALGGVLAKEGDRAGAEHWIAEALSVLRPTDADAELEVRKDQIFIAIAFDDIDGARPAIDAALILARRLGDRRAEGHTLGLQALCCEVSGDLEQADALCTQALDVMRDYASPFLLGVYTGQRGRVRLRLDPEAAEADLLHGISLMEGDGETAWPRLYRIMLALGQAEHRDPPDDLLVDAEHGSEVLVALRRGWVAVANGDNTTARQAVGQIDTVLASETLELSTAVLVQDLVGRLRVQVTAWRIRPDGTSLQPPGQPPVDLSRSAANARILAELVRMRLERPGQGSDVDTLLQAGWPGQRVVAKAAANRVRVALSALRKAGLAELIGRGPQGWYLEPDVPIRVDPTST